MKHGTRSMYTAGACRCSECKEANRAYRWLARGQRVLITTFEGGRAEGRMGRLVERAQPRHRGFTITDEGRAYLRVLKQEPAA